MTSEAAPGWGPSSAILLSVVWLSSHVPLVFPGVRIWAGPSWSYTKLIVSSLAFACACTRDWLTVFTASDYLRKQLRGLFWRMTHLSWHLKHCCYLLMSRIFSVSRTAGYHVRARYWNELILSPVSHLLGVLKNFPARICFLLGNGEWEIRGKTESKIIHQTWWVLQNVHLSFCAILKSLNSLCKIIESLRVLGSVFV